MRWSNLCERFTTPYGIRHLKLRHHLAGIE
jgi:hypothetical protein